MYTKLGPYSIPGFDILGSALIDWTVIVATQAAAAMASTASPVDVQAMTGADMHKLCAPDPVDGWGVASGGHGVVCGEWYDAPVGLRRFIVRAAVGGVAFPVENTNSPFVRAGVTFEQTAAHHEAVGFLVPAGALLFNGLRNVFHGVRGAHPASVTAGEVSHPRNGVALAFYDSGATTAGRGNIAAASVSGGNVTLTFKAPFATPPAVAPQVLRHGATRAYLSVESVTEEQVFLAARDTAHNPVNLPAGIRYSVLCAGFTA